MSEMGPMRRAGWACRGGSNVRGGPAVARWRQRGDVGTARLLAVSGPGLWVLWIGAVEWRGYERGGSDAGWQIRRGTATSAWREGICSVSECRGRFPLRESTSGGAAMLVTMWGMALRCSAGMGRRATMVRYIFYWLEGNDGK